MIKYFITCQVLSFYAHEWTYLSPKCPCVLDPHESLQRQVGGGGSAECEQPPCPPSPCHITIRSCSRAANYAGVWQPHCQRGERKAALEGENERGCILLLWTCELDAKKEDSFLVILCSISPWRQKVDAFRDICWLDFSQFKTPLIGWWNTFLPEGVTYIICLFDSSDKTNWILITPLEMTHFNTPLSHLESKMVCSRDRQRVKSCHALPAS